MLLDTISDLSVRTFKLNGYPPTPGIPTQTSGVHIRPCILYRVQEVDLDEQKKRYYGDKITISLNMGGGYHPLSVNRDKRTLPHILMNRSIS